MQTLLTHQVIMLGSMCVCSVLHTCMCICTRVCICAKARGQCYLSSVTAHLIVLRPGPSVNQELGFSKSQGSSCSCLLHIRVENHQSHAAFYMEIQAQALMHTRQAPYHLSSQQGFTAPGFLVFSVMCVFPCLKVRKRQWEQTVKVVTP